MKQETSMNGLPSTADYVYDDANRLIDVGGVAYTWDNNGNMTQRVEGGQTCNQTFDAENRLISVTVSGQTTQFVYDGDGNLVKKIKPDGTCTIYPSASLRAGVGGMYEVEKAACGGAVTHTKVYYPGGGAMRVDGTLYFVIKDHLGSASVVTNASGEIVDEQRYFPFDESRLGGDNMLTDRLFTGQREMEELGIYHYGARFYDPLLMRFIQPDTLIPNPADPQMLNRYSYAGNSPLNYSDPSGYTRIDEINRLKRAYGKHLWQ
jgi:RHS repeat-associated protein